MYIITPYVHNKTFVNFKLRWTSREKYLVTNVCYNEQHSAFSGWEFLVPVSLILSVPVTAGEVTTGLITRVTWLRSGSRCRDNGRGKPRRLRGRHTTPGQMRDITVFRERYFPSLNNYWAWVWVWDELGGWWVVTPIGLTLLFIHDGCLYLVCLS